MIFLLLSIGFVVYATAAPPTNDTGTTVEVVKQDGTVMDAQSLVQDWEVPGKHTDLVISVDELQEDGRLFASVSAAPQQEIGPAAEVQEDTGIGLSDFVKLNWLELLLGLMALLKVITNLSPSKKDNQIFSWLDSVFNAIVPNYKKGGGTHATPG